MSLSFKGLGFAVVLSVFASSAFAATPSMDRYEKIAKELLELSKNTPVKPASDEKIAKVEMENQLLKIKEGTRALILQGVQLAKDFEKKYPNCSEQYRVMIQELPEMEFQTEKYLSARYHDGDGLPKGDGCYLGRSQIIHPVLNLVRMNNEGWNTMVKMKVIHDFDEVVEHLEKIESKLK